MAVVWGKKSKWQIFKTEKLVDQSMASVDVKILFCKIIHHLEPEKRKILAWSLNGNETLFTLIYCLLKYTFYTIVSIRNFKLQWHENHEPASNAVILVQKLRDFF